MTTNLARELWSVAEPIHAVVYFAPEVAEAAKALGLKGWWMGYFAGRAAPMGAVSAPVVTASFFGFHSSMVERSIPDAWVYASPGAVIETRVASVASALRRIVGPDIREVAQAAEDDLRAAVGSLDTGGRPLAAAWAAVAETGDPVADLWLRLTALREHRGDGHVAACISHGLGALEATITMVATGRIPRESIQPHRGWSDEDWAAAEAALGDRGLLADGQLTDAGHEVRDAIEAATDALAVAPIERLGEERASSLVAQLRPIAQLVIDESAVPVPNPIGIARP